MREELTSRPGAEQVYVERDVVAPVGGVRPGYVVTPDPVAPAITERRVVTNRRFDPAAVLMVMVGVALGVIGAVAVARAGLSGPLDEPIVKVAGASHTALLGLIELGIGLVLVWAGLSRDRGVMLFCAVLFGAASLVAAIEPTLGGGALGIERSWAVVLVIAFAVLAAAAALVPSIRRSTDRIERI